VGAHVVENEEDAAVRAALIAAARAQMGRQDASLFNIRELCTEAGVTRAQFRQCFSGREELIEAVMNEDVAKLQDMAELAVEPRLALAANGGPAPAPQPVAPDAWLERRLRVFERALAALEARQDKSEQMLSRGIALLDERAAQPEEPLESILAAPAEAPETYEAVAQPEVEAEPRTAPPKSAPLPIPDLEPAPQLTAKEMDDLLTNARRAAREASKVEETPPVRSFVLPRWAIWTAVACLFLITATALAWNSMKGRPVAQADSTRHRQIAEGPLARTMALADSGDPISQTALAFAYLRGQGVPENTEAALRWGIAAGKQGDPTAQYLLGTLYRDGNGVAKDARQAFHWFEASALRGNIRAMHDVAIAYAEGDGTPQNGPRAAAWFNRAAGQGYVDSQFDLAVLYERGEGVKQNPQAALKWYLVAAKAGDAEAGQRAGQLSGQMKPEDVARARALADQFAPSARDVAANKS
jgi:localization factor PodJL